MPSSLFRPLWVAAAFALAVTGVASPALIGVAAGQQAGLSAADLSGLDLRTIGPAAMSGRFVDMDVVESDPYTYYVASANGGLFKTINNGVTFEPVFEREATHSIGDVAVHQGDPNIVWVGTGERANRQSSGWGDGVYKSTDAGETWTNVGLRESRHVGRIVLHPEDPELVYVAAIGHLWGANEERGLYRSKDGGESWERVLGIDEDTGVIDVAMDSENSNILYAAAYQRRRTAFGFHGGGPGSGLYRSDDGGDSWTELTGVALDPNAEENPDHPEGTLVNGLPAGEYGRMGISVYRSDPRIVYVSIEQGDQYTASTSYAGERFAGIYRSEDRGLTWQHMSDWNPRPMYASQILVDPSDDQRIYMQNSWSWSDDGGKTWTRGRQTIHGDDRFVWVNPNDSRHLIKLSDGAIGISYDKAATWLWVSHLPVSQYYRVGVDMADPYNVLGGLQDNGSWIGPNETYRSEGILNEDWKPIGGGDGFMSLADPSDPTNVYTESQYLGLTRLNLATGQARSIRPGNPEGYRQGLRRDWRLYGTDEEPRLLEQSMDPGNWDGPFILSPHDPGTVYAGTQHLYVSRDGGSSWRDLGRMSEEWERSEVEIMGQAPTRRVASLDDGVPYFATLTIIAESPLREGLLYIGTDDGNVQISRDGGDSWTNVARQFPGLPARTWVSDLAPSPHDEATVFASFDGHREDDNTNYMYRSDDYGQTWRSIVGDMPAERVIRAVDQDAVNPDLLYAAAEFGFFVSIDGGGNWVELKNDMPSLPINDFVIHPRDNDLVLGSHGRGVWILDSIHSLRELTPEVVASKAALFSVDPGRMTRRSRTTGPTGDMTYRGENPPVGAIIDYWLGESMAPEAAGEEAGSGRGARGGGAARVGDDDAAPARVTLTVHDDTGNVVRTLNPTLNRGINRVVWNLRHEGPPAAANVPQPRDPALAGGGGRGFGGFGGGGGGPLVVPGVYTVRLTVDGETTETTVEAQEDRRINASVQARRSWTALQLEINDFYTEINEMAAAAIERENALKEDAGEGDAGVAAAVQLREELIQLRGRVQSLRGSISRWVGSPTAGQRGELRFYREVAAKLAARAQGMMP